jgi:hypothetical protein
MLAGTCLVLGSSHGADAMLSLAGGPQRAAWLFIQSRAISSQTRLRDRAAIAAGSRLAGLSRPPPPCFQHQHIPGKDRDAGFLGVGEKVTV